MSKEYLKKYLDLISKEDYSEEKITLFRELLISLCYDEKKKNDFIKDYNLGGVRIGLKMHISDDLFMFLFQIKFPHKIKIYIEKPYSFYGNQKGNIIIKKIIEHPYFYFRKKIISEFFKISDVDLGIKFRDLHNLSVYDPQRIEIKGFENLSVDEFRGLINILEDILTDFDIFNN